MSRRYSRVLAAGEAKKALDNYINYVRTAGNRQTKRLVGGTAPDDRPRIPVALRPFGKKLPSDDYYLIQATEKAVTKLLPKLDTRIKRDADTLKKAERYPKFQPAKVIFWEPDGNTAVYKQSAVTKLFYPKRNGTSYTAPFGSLTDTEEFATVASKVKDEVGSLSANKYAKVNIKGEVFP